jgi:hypothetical protein
MGGYPLGRDGAGKAYVATLAEASSSSAIRTSLCLLQLCRFSAASIADADA